MRICAGLVPRFGDLLFLGMHIVTKLYTSHLSHCPRLVWATIGSFGLPTLYVVHVPLMVPR